jgi:chromosome segregation ATPase
MRAQHAELVTDAVADATSDTLNDAISAAMTVRLGYAESALEKVQASATQRLDAAASALAEARAECEELHSVAADRDSLSMRCDSLAAEVTTNAAELKLAMEAVPEEMRSAITTTVELETARSAVAALQQELSSAVEGNKHSQAEVLAAQQKEHVAAVDEARSNALATAVSRGQQREVVTIHLWNALRRAPGKDSPSS